MTGNREKLGVVIGRFQVASLTEAHREILTHARKENDRLLVLLGCTGGSPTDMNPLSFEQRRHVISDYLYNGTGLMDVNIFPLYDNPLNDAAWSASVDQTIATVVGRESVSVRLYGGRSSFIPHYTGKHSVEKFSGLYSDSGTASRLSAANHTLTPDYLTGIIAAHQTRYPLAYSVVDIAIYNATTHEVLLGRKNTDAPNTWGFLGGHVDVEDKSLEMAASREAFEESGGLGIGPVRYLGSAKIHDPRYLQGKDGMIGALFVAEYLYGRARASDDIDEVKWFSCADIDFRSLVIPHHQQHLATFLAWEHEHYPDFPIDLPACDMLTATLNELSPHTLDSGFRTPQYILLDSKSPDGEGVPADSANTSSLEVDIPF